jgi:hypothetical protein
MADKQASGAAAPLSSGQQARVAKREYRSPALVNYGSVRQLTTGSTGDVGDAGGKTMQMSDPALKENVVRIGDHPAGFGLYLFDYKEGFRDLCGRGRQFGVMADEVERIIPEAVSVNVDGYRVVNYALLGLCRIRH